MKTFDCEQYTEQWWTVRRGIPTASRFDCILTPKTGKPSAAADTYIAELIGQLYDPNYGNDCGPVSHDMARGLAFEPESRRWYEMERSLDVHQVGFCLMDDGRFGCSPDGLVGEEGLLELKNPSPRIQVQYLLAGELPSEYKPQVHGQLIVTGRQRVDFLSYCPGLPPLLIRVVADEYTFQLKLALNGFYARYQEALGRIRALDHHQPLNGEPCLTTS